MKNNHSHFFGWYCVPLYHAYISWYDLFTAGEKYHTVWLTFNLCLINLRWWPATFWVPNPPIWVLLLCSGSRSLIHCTHMYHRYRSAYMYDLWIFLAPAFQHDSRTFRMVIWLLLLLLGYSHAMCIDELISRRTISKASTYNSSFRSKQQQ